MAEQTSAAGESTAPATKRATTRRRSTTARRARAATTSTPKAARSTRKRATARKAAPRKTASSSAAAPRRRGRPPGSRNRTAAASVSSPADAMSKRIHDLITENKALKAQVKDLEAGWKKIEKAFGTEVSRVKRTVRRKARAATRKVVAVVDAVTS